MTSRSYKWLERAEYIGLVLTLASALFCLAVQVWFLPIFFLTLTLGSNLLNRKRERIYNKRKWRDISEQMRDLSPIGVENNARSLSELRGEIGSIETSLNNLIDYIDHQALKERIEHLEKSLGQIKKELSLTLPPPTATETPKISLPSLNIASPPLEIPRWDIAVSILAHEDAISAIEITEDGKYLITVSWDGYLKIWDFSTGESITEASAGERGILALAVGENGGYKILTGGFDRLVSVRCFDGARLTLEKTYSGHFGSIYGLAFIPDSDLIVSAGYDGNLKRWGGTNPIDSHDASGAIYALAVAKNGEFIATGGADGRITLWKTRSPEKIGVLTGNVSSVKTLAISGDNRLIVAGCADGTVKLWLRERESTMKKPFRIIEAHDGQVNALLFDVAGGWLWTGGTDGEVKIWRVDYREAIATLPLPVAIPVSGLAKSADNRFLAVGFEDGSVSIWRNAP